MLEKPHFYRLLCCDEKGVGNRPFLDRDVHQHRNRLNKPILEADFRTRFLIGLRTYLFDKST